MIKRIVKMTFRQEEVDKFVNEVFEQSKHKIRKFDGCKHMELLRGTTEGNVLFTYSIWESEEHLDTYRHSDLFKETWAKTKALFEQKPEAWSLFVVDPDSK